MLLRLGRAIGREGQQRHTFAHIFATAGDRDAVNEFVRGEDRVLAQGYGYDFTRKLRSFSEKLSFSAQAVDRRRRRVSRCNTGK